MEAIDKRTFSSVLPNGLNDVFEVKSRFMRGIRLTLYQRSGVPFYESTDATPHWDGTLRGQPLPGAIYAYQVQGLLPDGTPFSKRGAVQLVR